MTLQKIIQFIGELISKGFTGSITLNFHNGDVSRKIEKKSFEVIE